MKHGRIHLSTEAKNSFDRTVAELKPTASKIGLSREARAPFDRTVAELKLIRKKGNDEIKRTFDRTVAELKV